MEHGEKGIRASLKAQRARAKKPSSFNETRPDFRHDQMNEKDDEITDPGMVANPKRPLFLAQFSNSPWTRVYGACQGAGRGRAGDCWCHKIKGRRWKPPRGKTN